MSKEIEEQIDKIPVVNKIVELTKQVYFPKNKTFSLYDLLELYVLGIFKGAFSYRASAIAFSFFTAIFPFLLFVIILIPIIPIQDFQNEFLMFLESVLPPQTSDFFTENIFENIEGRQQAGLLSSVFLLSMLLMANGVNAVFSGFENSYHKQLTRNAFGLERPLNP